MKQFPSILAAVALMAITACTKEIDLDLKNESNKVVIEATLNEGAGPHTVRVTRSVGFGETNDFPGVDHAVVNLSDDQGNSELLTENGNGNYVTSILQGVQQRTYHMSVQVDGTPYTADCAMPVAVSLDTLLVDSFPGFGMYTRTIVPVYHDPAGQANYYRFIVRVNGEKLEGINVDNDRFTDGNLVLQPLFVDGLELESGDVVEVTMQSITPAVYDYFFSMMQNTTNAATPADPTSNINGGALGYFSVHTASTKIVVVP